MCNVVIWTALDKEWQSHQMYTLRLEFTCCLEHSPRALALDGVVAALLEMIHSGCEAYYRKATRLGNDHCRLIKGHRVADPSNHIAGSKKK